MRILCIVLNNRDGLRPLLQAIGVPHWGAENAPNSNQYRDACLDRAVFYVLWHGGLRLGEVEVLQCADLNLGQNRLTVPWGKGAKDRTVYLTEVAVKVLKTYLELRGTGKSDNVFMYRNHPLTKDMVHRRLKARGKRTGIHVTAHRLRLTNTTQLVNVGCKVTFIQRLLGHKRLNSTMIYVRIHDHTVAEDYYAAMTVIEID